MMVRFGLAAFGLAAMAGAQTPPVQGGASGNPGNAANHQQHGRAAAHATNKAALNSPRPNTLKASDLNSSTTDVGGGAAVDKAKTKKPAARRR